MFTAATIVCGLLAAALVMSGRAKLVKVNTVIAAMAKVRFPPDKLWLLAAAEIAGAAGLVAGLFWWPLGIAAATGVIAYFTGAVASHLRVHDKDIAPAAVLLLAAVAALTLRATTT